MHCDIRLRVSVTCTFTIKHGTQVPIATYNHLYDAYRLLLLIWSVPDGL